MKRTFLFLGILALIPALISCSKVKGKGAVVSEMRDVTGYTAISLSMEGDLYFTPDSAYYIEIQAQQNVIDVIETKMEGSTLVLKLENNTVLGKHDAIRFYIHAPSVNNLDISGSGAIYTNGIMDKPTLTYNISGSGNMNISEVKSRDVYGTISGSGNLQGQAGITDFETLNISGSGSMDFQNVTADSVYVTISGSGDVSVSAVKFLNVTISGSGNVRYSGNPIIDQHISGAGRVIHI